MVGILKKTAAAALLMMIFFPGSAYSAEDKQPEESFRITDIFKYNHPVLKAENEKKWNFNLSGSYTQKKGNTETMRTSYAGTIQYDDNITSFKFTGQGSYGKTSGIKDEDRGSASLNYDRYLLWHFELFTYTISDYNDITGLVHRNNSGAGLKYVFIHNSYLLLDLSGAPVLQYENYEQVDTLVDWRWSVRGRLEVFPGDESFTFKCHSYYVQKMDDMKNYRTIQDLSVYKKLVGIVGVRAGYKREFDTHTKEYFAQNPLVKKTDTTYYCQASVTF